MLNFLNGFRKFTLMMVLISVGIIFRLTNHINGIEFVELIKGAAIAFMAGNGMEHMVAAVKDWLSNQK